MEVAMTSRVRFSSGFTLIELLMVLILVSVLTVVSIEAINSSMDDSRFQETLNEMRAISDAIVGNRDLREGGTRTSFGYFGDVGALPAAIGGLTTIPGGVSAYTVNSTARTAYGWNGAYLQGGDSGTDYTSDAWGTAYVYSPGATPPTLVSYGADGVAGGTGLDQDITISWPVAERTATVEGFVSSAGSPYTAGAEAELNYPNGSGGLTQSLDTNLAAENGHFSFTSVPYGVRSITIYQGTKAAPTATIGPVIITVDRPQVLVPANQLDFSP